MTYSLALTNSSAIYLDLILLSVYYDSPKKNDLRSRPSPCHWHQYIRSGLLAKLYFGIFYASSDGVTCYTRDCISINVMYFGNKK